MHTVVPIVPKYMGVTRPKGQRRRCRDFEFALAIDTRRVSKPLLRTIRDYRPHFFHRLDLQVIIATMKRKDVPDLQEALDKRWCYYCERIFQDDAVLCEHQRIKHFRCDWDEQYSCGKKFTTAGGLSVHMAQVHKSKLEKIQNTIDGREDPQVEIFGMLGIPQVLLDNHRRAIENQYYQAEAEHRARTGNPLRGPNPNAGKQQVLELTHEQKMAKLEAHRAKNRANKAAREAGFKDAEDQARQLVNRLHLCHPSPFV